MPSYLDDFDALDDFCIFHEEDFADLDDFESSHVFTQQEESGERARWALTSCRRRDARMMLVDFMILIHSQC